MSAESDKAVRLLERLVFDRNAPPIVVALVGGWGEGKTHFWRQVVEPKFLDRNPAYVSVFGAHSLAEIRTRVVVERMAKGDASTKIRTGSFREKLRKARAWMASAASKAVEAAEEHLGLPDAFVAQMLQGSALDDGGIICFDDIERRSEGVDIDELLGYFSELRDRWKLRVVLIFNRRTFDNAQDDTFRKYEEKVIDRTIPFCLDLAFVLSLVFADLKISHRDVLAGLHTKASALNLRNIRLFHKTKSHFDEVVSNLEADASPLFLEEVLHALLLFIFIRYSDKCPADLTFELVVGHNEWIDLMERNERSKSITEKDKPLSPAKKILEAYGFKYASDLDKLLVDFVRTGLLNGDHLAQVHRAFETDFKRGALADNLRSVLDTHFQNTFGDNAAETCDAIERAIEPYLGLISSQELDFPLKFLERFGRPERASELFARFLELRASELDRLKGGDDPIGQFEYLPLRDLIIGNRERNSEDKRTLAEVLDSAFDQNFVVQADMERIKAFSGREIADYFLSHKLPHLRARLRTLIQSAQGDTRELILDAAEILAANSEVDHYRIHAMDLLHSRRRPVGEGSQ